MSLILRPLRADDEAQARTAHEELLVDGFEFLFGLTDDLSWTDYLDQRARSAADEDIAENLVADTFLGAFVGDTLVGRMSLRHSLNDPAGFLRLAGGHIGYAVRPAHRRRGHAVEILRQSLGLAAGRGIDPALLTCDDTNIASASVIERCGGRFDGIVTDPKTGKAKRRYWVPTGLLTTAADPRSSR